MDRRRLWGLQREPEPRIREIAMQIGKIGAGLLTMALAVALTAPLAAAQDDDGKRKRRSNSGQDDAKNKKRKQRGVFGLPPGKALIKALELDKEVAKKLKPAFETAMKTMGELRKAREGGAERKDLGKKFKAAREALIKAITAELNEEQAKKFAKMSERKKRKKGDEKGDERGERGDK